MLLTWERLRGLAINKYCWQSPSPLVSRILQVEDFLQEPPVWQTRKSSNLAKPNSKIIVILCDFMWFYVIFWRDELHNVCLPWAFTCFRSLEVILLGFSHRNHPFGVPHIIHIYGNHHIVLWSKEMVSRVSPRLFPRHSTWRSSLKVQWWWDTTVLS